LKARETMAAARHAGVRPSFAAAAAAAALLLRLPVAAGAPARVGDAFGTNIHWTSAQPGEARLLSAAYRVARMDLNWGSIETAGACGTYDFQAYDTLLAEMEAVGVRPYWILDYNNQNCYPSPASSCETPACVAGYGRFAAATVAHFKGHGIIFESVNEANGMGDDNATVVTELCKAAGPHFLAAGETFVGPTTAGIDIPYLNATFALGILGALSGVSVHPYRSGPPESAAGDLQQLAAIIAAYAAPDKAYPVLSGEWGYTSAALPCNYGNRVPAALQGKYVPRMWFAALLGGATVGISYDWKDDGGDPTNCEDNFGSVVQGPGGTFTPKPSYLAALAVQTGVGNAAAFSGRVAAAVSGVPPTWGLTPASAFVLAFAGGGLPQPAAAFAVYTNVTTCVLAAVPGARAACAGPGGGANETACLAAGCCFDGALPANATGVPACYVAAQPPQAPNPVCPDAERVDCGFNGITHDECVGARGCCWDGSAHPSGPQCFFGEDGRVGGPVTVTFPIAPAADDACFDMRDVYGYDRGRACAAGGAISVTATDGPMYLL